MNVKTITAPTIHAALLEARRILGNDVVLMESIPPQGDEPARITVMSDAPDRTSRAVTSADVRKTATQTTDPGMAPAHRSARRTRETAVASKAAAGETGRGEINSETNVAVLQEEAARRPEPLSHKDGAVPAGRYGFDVGRRTLRDLTGAARESLPELKTPADRRDTSGHGGRGQLNPNRRELVPVPNTPALQDPIGAIESVLSAQLRLVHDRLDQMERRFDRAIIGAGQAWTMSPLFTALINQGMRPATATKLFDRLAKNNYQPETNPETLKWALAQEIRRSLDLSAPRKTSGAQVFIGPAGAGKTSLLLKLAAHPEFYGRRGTAVVVIAPQEDEGTFHHSPLELFRSHGLPVQAVRTVEEMHRAVTRVQHFDHILIDSPPMPLHEAGARRTLRHVKRMVDPIMPLRVHFVLNATRTLDGFDSEFLRELALRPEMVALTHLDETSGWGRVADWLMTIQMPVQYVSSSPAVPDGVTSFSPTAFIEEMMKL